MKGNPFCKSASHSWVCSQSSVAGVAVTEGDLLNLLFLSHLSHDYIKWDRTCLSNCVAVFNGEVQNHCLRESFSHYFGYWSFLNGKPVYKYCCPAPLEIIEKWKWLQLQNNNYPTAGRPDAQLDIVPSRWEWERGMSLPRVPAQRPDILSIPTSRWERVGTTEQSPQDLYTWSCGRHPGEGGVNMQLREDKWPAQCHPGTPVKDGIHMAQCPALCCNLFSPTWAPAWSRQVTAAANAMGWLFLFIYLFALKVIRCFGALCSSGRTL